MSHTHKHLMAILPLFSILTMSPMTIQSKVSRSIASIEVESSFPKYEARAAKIDRSKIEIDQDLDLTCFSERGEDLRHQLMTERQKYNVKAIEKLDVKAQKIRLDGLVSSLVNLEEDLKALDAKGAFTPDGKKIASESLQELKITLESLLIDEVENDIVVQKNEVESQPSAEPSKSKEDQQICELEEKNKTLTKQLEDLLGQQEKIMQSLLDVSQLVVQMNQTLQQSQYVIPNWMLSGPMMNPQQQYSYYPSYAPQSPGYSQPIGGGMGLPQSQSFLNYSSSSFTTPQLGEQAYQQSILNPNLGMNMPQDPRYTLQSHIPGNFGLDGLGFNFGT